MGFLKRVYNYLYTCYSPAVVGSAVVIGLVTLLSAWNTSAATGPRTGTKGFATVVQPNEPGALFMRGPSPGTIVVCRGEPESDELHICQIWLEVGQGSAIPSSPKAYCFAAGEEEVIHNGEPTTRVNWSCGLDRNELSEQRKAQGPVNFRKRQSRPGTLSI